MNYIDLLTQEEKAALCRIITGRDFKEFFRRNEQEFSKIRKGFRAKSLNENTALSIAIANVDKPFITAWINLRIDIWIKEINDNIERLKAEGSTADNAMAMTMIDSVFVNNVDLYLKLSGEATDEGSRSKLRDNIEFIKAERAIEAEVANRTRAIEEENQRLLDQINDVQKRFDDMQVEYQRKLNEIEQEKATLETSLADAQKEITELKTVPSNVRNENTNYLAQFDDTDMSALPHVGDENVVSLCGVTSDYNGQKWLIRYADLNCKGNYYIFRKNNELSPYFTNRDKIFHMDGPSDEGFYGVWTWSATERTTDPSKDYVLSWYHTGIDAIEVVTPSEASCLDDLIDMLKRGIEYTLHSRKVMFAVVSLGKQYTGIMCNIDELITDKGKLALRTGCEEVPVYEFTSNEVMLLDNGLSFYKNAFAGPPVKLYQLKSPLEIVRNIVLTSLSWNAYKLRGFSRTEYKTIREFLKEIPVDDILHRIEIACHCSNPAAKTLLDDFLATVWKYIDGNSLDDAIILSAINANTELQERMKSLIRTDWETEHKDLLDKAQQKLQSINDALIATTAQINEANKALEKEKSEEKRLTNIIAEKEKLAEDVEIAVAKRIQRARENAAEFIANMSFWSAQPTQIVEADHPVVEKSLLESVGIQYRVLSAIGDLKDLEAHHTWADVISTVTFELEEAGVAERYSSGLAAFLCAAYIRKQPILLVGPNAIDITQAFSAAIGRKYGVLCCEGNYDGKAIERIGKEDEGIVIVNNLISSSWINRLPEILSQKDVFYIVTHPYAEDIQVEPKSLYGFMLPLFTEFFVDKIAIGEYQGGYFANDFKDYSASKDAHIELKAISKLALSALTKTQINNLATTMHGIYSAATADEDFLFAVLPIMYASLAMNDLTEIINDSQNGINITANLKRDLQYVLGET